MLDLNSAKVIMEAVNTHFGTESLTIGEVCRMQPISVSTKGGYTVLGLQKGDLTIMVWISVTNDEFKAVKVNTQAW